METLTLKYVILAAVWSGGASAACSYYLNAEQKDILWCGLLGALSWVIYLLAGHFSGSVSMGYFIGALVVSVLSETLAFTMHNPATVYLLPGLLPLVPGAGIFLMMRSAILENMESALLRLYEVLGAAGSIALGVAISSSFFKIIQAVIRKRRLADKAEKEKKAQKELEEFEK